MTTHEQNKRIYELFVTAREMDTEARAVYLDNACADDPEARKEVQALLAQDSKMTCFLEQSPAGKLAPVDGDDPVTLSSAGKVHSKNKQSAEALAGIVIEGYEVLRELHRGGQGVVFQAIQKATKRKVAIKVLREGPYATKSAQKRFEREIELVAQLKHPNIIAIFDSGTTREGWRYCAMDYVRGLPLNQYVRENKLTLEQTLVVFDSICNAIQYAHYRGVIHRDLKPTNILVDSDGDPKVLDFGLAKQLIGPVETVLSITQEVVGTLPYMSPEQAKGNPDHVDTRTDIYALGVILYELLTGHYPYPVVGHMTAVLQHIAETPPTPPSRQWTADSGITQRSRKHLRAGRCPIDDELQTVMLKTLAKERDRRYASAAELGADIQHYLRNEPINAKRDSGWYVFKKGVHRHRRKIVVTGIFVALLGCLQAYHRHQQTIEARREHATELILLATQDKELGHWEDAWKKIQESLALAPESYRPLVYAAWIKKEDYTMNRAFAFRDHALLEEASDFCDQALALESGKPGVWNLKASILLGLGDLQGAEEACRQALDLDVHYCYAESTLAKVLAVQGHIDQALRVAANAAEHVEETNDYADDAWRTLATLQLYANDPAVADSLLNAQRINHRDTRTWLLLARSHMTLLGQVDNVEALFAARLADAFRMLVDPRYKRILAQAQLRNELWPDALTSAEAAVQGGDEPAAYAHFIAATAAARLGDREVANRHLRLGNATWPPEFDDSDVRVTAEKEFLWLDTLEELQALKTQAEQALASGQDHEP